LLRETSSILLDGSANEDTKHHIQYLIENDADNQIADLHVWKVNANDTAAIISLVTHYPRRVDHYRHLLANMTELKHITIEINICDEQSCLPVNIPVN
jgi:Co/Zn/Cd efflux system component